MGEIIRCLSIVIRKDKVKAVLLVLTPVAESGVTKLAELVLMGAIKVSESKVVNMIVGDLSPKAFHKSFGLRGCNQEGSCNLDVIHYYTLCCAWSLRYSSLPFYI